MVALSLARVYTLPVKRVLFLKALAKPLGDGATGSILLGDPPIDHDAVRRQLERLIASPFFNQSRRYSSLLRYVVEETLDGRSDRLKERTVGIDVFGRNPSYDTNADPVVRTTAAQLRHRLARYYSQPGHEGEVRIGLPPGAYVPEFRQPDSGHKVFALQVEVEPERDLGGITSAEVAPVLVEAKSPGRPASSINWPRLLLLAGVAVVLVAASIAAFYQIQASREDASLRKFWGPVWDSGGSVLICIGGGQNNNGAGNQASAGTQTAEVAAPASGPTVAESLRANSVAWPDAMVTAELAGLAKSKGQTVRLRKSGLIGFADLRESPDILVGGFNNQWIMRLDANLRYRYVRDREADISYIQDQKNPDRRDWGVHFRQPYATFLQDYGVITRVLDTQHGKDGYHRFRNRVVWNHGRGRLPDAGEIHEEGCGQCSQGVGAQEHAGGLLNRSHQRQRRSAAHSGDLVLVAVLSFGIAQVGGESERRWWQRSDRGRLRMRYSSFPRLVCCGVRLKPSEEAPAKSWLEARWAL